MPRNTIPLAILATTLVVVIAIILITSQQLPARVASHFNAAGQPDGWMSRTAYTLTIVGMTLGLTASLLAVFGLTRFFPNSMINLPNRDYWLAPNAANKRATPSSATAFGWPCWKPCCSSPCIGWSSSPMPLSPRTYPTPCGSSWERFCSPCPHGHFS